MFTVPALVFAVTVAGLLPVLAAQVDKARDYTETAARALDAYTACGEATPCFESTLNQALAPWETSGITPAHLKAMHEVRDAQRLTFYQIIDGKLFRDDSQFAGLGPGWTGCFIQSRCKGIEFFLREVLSRAAKDGTSFPDVEFFVNVRDTPTSSKRRHVPGTQTPMPILSFSVSTDRRFADIMYPNWAFHQGGPWLKELSSDDNNRVWNWDIMLEELASSSSSTPWNQKKDVLFFRGSRTTDTRDALVDLGQHDDPLFDIQYTKGTSKRADAKRKSPAFPQVHLRDHCQYR